MGDVCVAGPRQRRLVLSLAGKWRRGCTGMQSSCCTGPPPPPPPPASPPPPPWLPWSAPLVAIRSPSVDEPDHLRSFLTKYVMYHYILCVGYNKKTVLSRLRGEIQFISLSLKDFQ